jgi:phage terminase small subunit
MPILPNPKHELFAQERAKGLSAGQAYVAAGFSKNDSNAARLNRNEQVVSRVAELLAVAADRNGITIDRIISELAKIGFADIRRVVKWGESVAVKRVDGDEVVVSHDIALLSSAEIDDDIAGAIAEVRQTKEGLAVKLHDKRAALVDLGKHLGMFVEKHQLFGPNGGPIQQKFIVEFVGADDEAPDPASL